MKFLKDLGNNLQMELPSCFHPYDAGTDHFIINNEAIMGQTLCMLNYEEDLYHNAMVWFFFFPLYFLLTCIRINFGVMD